MTRLEIITGLLGLLAWPLLGVVMLVFALVTLT